MNPPIIFKLELALANLVKIFADVIASCEKATAVGPVNNFSNFLILLPSNANFVILFFVILKKFHVFSFLLLTDQFA